MILSVIKPRSCVHAFTRVRWRQFSQRSGSLALKTFWTGISSSSQCHSMRSLAYGAVEFWDFWDSEAYVSRNWLIVLNLCWFRANWVPIWLRVSHALGLLSLISVGCALGFGFRLGEQNTFRPHRSMVLLVQIRIFIFSWPSPGILFFHYFEFLPKYL